MNNKIISQEDFLSSKKLRNQIVTEKNLIVLDQVKAVPYFPNDMFVGIKQAANYYEVSIETLKKCTQRHRDELEKDGLKRLPYEEINKYRDLFNQLREDDSESYIGNKARSFVYIPKKALLRIGMLLTKSDVALQIRTYLLNIEKNSSQEQKLESIAEIANKNISMELVPIEDSILDDRRLSIKQLELDIEEINLNNKKELSMVEKFTRKAELLGIPSLEASILIQQSIIQNEDVERAILERLKSYEDLNLTISRGRLRSQISIVAENLFKNDVSTLYYMLSEKLRPILGINMRSIRAQKKKKYGEYSKKVPSYLDLIADYKAWDLAEKALEEIKLEKIAMNTAIKSKYSNKRNNILPEVK